MPSKPLTQSESRRSSRPAADSSVRVLIVVEGTTDITLLQNITSALTTEDELVPNLAELALRGEVLFLPFGGGNVAAWYDRLGPLQLPEVHLYDGERPPETEVRQRAASCVNQRPHCRAFVTSRRSLENYLHPAAILAAGGPAVSIGTADDVGFVVAKAQHQANHDSNWYDLRYRQRGTLVHKTKRWLATTAARQMNCELLAGADPSGEVRSWLAAISELGQLTGSKAACQSP